ncbi:hypothetical protein U1Q18_015006 [Sarracenia purpurea var. burkii]
MQARTVEVDVKLFFFSLSRGVDYGAGLGAYLEADSDAEYQDGKTVSGQWSKTSTLLTSKASSLRSKRTNKVAKSLSEDLFNQLEDEPLDLLDRQKTRSALRSSEHLKRKQDSDDEPEIDSEGRLIIREGRKKLKREMLLPNPDREVI